MPSVETVSIPSPTPRTPVYLANEPRKTLGLKRPKLNYQKSKLHTNKIINYTQSCSTSKDLQEKQKFKVTESKAQSEPILRKFNSFDSIFDTRQRDINRTDSNLMTSSFQTRTETSKFWPMSQGQKTDNLQPSASGVARTIYNQPSINHISNYMPEIHPDNTIMGKQTNEQFDSFMANLNELKSSTKSSVVRQKEVSVSEIIGTPQSSREVFNSFQIPPPLRTPHPLLQKSYEKSLDIILPAPDDFF